MVDFVASESGKRYILELDPHFIAETNKLAADLPELTAEQIADLDEIEKANQPSSTSNQTRQHVLKFKNFLKNKRLCESFETVPDNYLCDYLRYFYANIRKDDESLYAPASLICIRSSASVQRYIRTSDQQLQTASRCLSDVSCTTSKNEMSEVAPQMQTVLNNISK